MEPDNTIIKNKTERIKMLYNDDVLVLDYLADLQDRGPIKAMDRFMKFGNNKTMCLLFHCKPDHINLVILYKAPFGFNEGENRFMLYAHHELIELCRYFKRWHDNTSKSLNEDQHNALNDITRLLYMQWAEQEEENPTADYRG